MKKKSLAFISFTMAALMLAGCGSGGVDIVAPSEESAWNVVLETTIPHDTNMEGFLNENFGITVGQHGLIFTTADGATIWNNGENSSMCRYCLDIVDENLAWAGGNGSNVRVSHDGGKTWDAVSDINLLSTHTNIDFIDDTTGWICSGRSCAATTNGGETWTELTLPETINGVGIATIAIRSANDGYVLANDGALYITNDGGTTWEQKSIGFENYNTVDLKDNQKMCVYNTTVADMNFYDENNGMIVFAGFRVEGGSVVWCLTTTDGGNSWTAEEVPVDNGMTVTKVYLSNDGHYLTLGSLTKDVLVLNR